MRTVTVQLRADNVIGTTDPRLFGAFIEHLGRCVYGEPGHPTSDERGFCGGVLALVQNWSHHHALCRRQFRLRL